jgi:hypothetical protein
MDAVGLGPINQVVSKAGAAHGRGAGAAETATFLAGVGLILFAVIADRSWLDRHLLPHLFLQRSEQILWWMVERSLAILIGIALIMPVRRRVGRAFRSGRGCDLCVNVLLMVAAVLLALLASELILRTGNWARVERWAQSEEPLRHVDPMLGWANIPARIGGESYQGRDIRYVLDADGRRIPDLAHPIDPRRPSILFAGESMMFGFRLNWPETAAGQIEKASGLQSVNIAVNGYGVDQELMRLRQELPRFTKPVAVVALFAPTLLERSLDSHRPHLDATLRWHAARPAWRLERVFKNLLLYHSTAAIDAGVAMTRSNLVAIVAEARARGAVPLILVPEFTPEQPVERRLRERVLAGLPYVLVELDPHWSIPGDGHPDARANRAMADAVLAVLAAHLQPRRAS